MALLHEAGQSLVEFALVTLFVILPVTFGIIDGGILFYKWVALTNAAREGARAGAIYQSSTVSIDADETELALVDGERANVITQTVQVTIGPLVGMDDWYIDYPDSPCVIGQNPNTCGDCAVYDVHRGGVCRDGEYHAGGHRVSVTITHTHTSLVGLVIGLGGIDLSATATMRIEPGGSAPAPPPSP